MALGTALLGASVGQQLFSAFRGRSKERSRRRQRRSFFDNELQPLLNEAIPDTDIDFGSLRNAEMQMPVINLQEGMRSLSRTADSARGQSGFANSSFIERDLQNSQNIATSQFENQQFNVDRGLLDLQSQIEGIASQNRIRAKELEYSYKYG